MLIVCSPCGYIFNQDNSRQHFTYVLKLLLDNKIPPVVVVRDSLALPGKTVSNRRLYFI